MAERVGFEPTCRLPDKPLSRRSRYDHFGTSPQRKSWRAEHAILLQVWLRSSALWHRGPDMRTAVRTELQRRGAGTLSFSRDVWYHAACRVSVPDLYA